MKDFGVLWTLSSYCDCTLQYVHIYTLMQGQEINGSSLGGSIAKEAFRRRSFQMGPLEISPRTRVFPVRGPMCVGHIGHFPFTYPRPIAALRQPSHLVTRSFPLFECKSSLSASRSANGESEMRNFG